MIKKPKNENYTGTVAEIKILNPMYTTKGELCSSIQSTNIFGNTVVVGVDCKIGDVGIFFPVETQLSQKFLYENSLYRDTTLNKDKTHKGLFETNGRIKCQKLQGTPSMGFFCPLSYLDYTSYSDKMTLGVTFDELNGVEVCQKYIPKTNRINGSGNGTKKNMGKVKRTSKLVDNQFRFHADTGQFGRNLHMFEPTTMCGISLKFHGTSIVISKILTKKKLSKWQKFLKLIGGNIIETVYGNIYSTRRVVHEDLLK